MLQIGGRPILENILQQFIAYGFRQFYFCVNYKAEVIKSYFGEGTRWGVNIQYLHESVQGGTAGGLASLPRETDLPILVMNGDIMTQVNIEALLNFHTANQAMATVCIREHSHTIPFGVVQMNESTVSSIVEKPVNRYFVNAGIYVLNPRLLAYIPKVENYGMPTLLHEAMLRGDKVAGFPIHEYWLDVGRMEDFEKAHNDFMGLFE
jgi:NDP-sugar pyrophosphorylase family protein